MERDEVRGRGEKRGRMEEEQTARTPTEVVSCVVKCGWEDGGGEALFSPLPRPVDVCGPCRSRLLGGASDRVVWCGC